MNILMVEDDVDFAEEFHKSLIKKLGQQVHITRVLSRDEAFALLDNHSFDLVILDLKLPSHPGALDEDTTHGEEIFRRIQEVSPGTPIHFLSGFATEDFVINLLNNYQVSGLLWSGQEKENLYKFSRKANAIKALAEIEIAFTALAKLNGSVEIVLDDGAVPLDYLQKRLLRLFAASLECQQVRVGPIGGGLSSSSILRVRAFRGGALTASAVAKIDHIASIEHEMTRYHFVTVLDPGAFAQHMMTAVVGGGPHGALFYRLADSYGESMNELILRDCPASVRSIQACQRQHRAWIQGASSQQTTVGDIRRSFLADEKLEEILREFPELPRDLFSEAEQLQLNTRFGTQHGDMHGANLLVNKDGTPIMIDYGDVGRRPLCVDPTVLELSLLFHPLFKNGRTAAWPTLEHASRWPDVNEFVRDSPFADAIRACREWSVQLSDGRRAILAAAYGYSLRQFKYQDPDKAIAGGIAIAAARALLDT